MVQGDRSRTRFGKLQLPALATFGLSIAVSEYESVTCLTVETGHRFHRCRSLDPLDAFQTVLPVLILTPVSAATISTHVRDLWSSGARGRKQHPGHCPIIAIDSSQHLTHTVSTGIAEPALEWALRARMAVSRPCAVSGRDRQLGRSTRQHLRAHASAAGLPQRWDGYDCRHHCGSAASWRRARPRGDLLRVQRDQRNAQARIFQELAQATFHLRQVIELLWPMQRINRTIRSTKSTGNVPANRNVGCLARTCPQRLQCGGADALVVTQGELEELDLGGHPHTHVGHSSMRAFACRARWCARSASEMSSRSPALTCRIRSGKPHCLQLSAVLPSRSNCRGITGSATTYYWRLTLDAVPDHAIVATTRPDPRSLLQAITT
jgi:hypothetical protein